MIDQHPNIQVDLATFVHADACDFLVQHTAYGDTPAIIFADPPFNIGVEYATADDDKPDDQYLKWTETWFGLAAGCLAADGSLWVNIPDRWAAEFVLLGKRLGLKLENWAIWHHRFGTWQPKRFIVSKTHALWFSKGKPFVDPTAALVRSDRAAIYSDARTVDNAGWRMELDVWGFDPYWGRVQGNNRERRPLHPNQLPEQYLKRIISVCSEEGHTVLDPFCGSGTTATVANALRRYCVTSDVSEVYLKSAAERCALGMIAR
jgi:site-specific DNA-methyltransferase (adenine-specific)